MNERVLYRVTQESDLLECARDEPFLSTNPSITGVTLASE
jgi:hypothetical protein